MEDPRLHERLALLPVAVAGVKLPDVVLGVERYPYGSSGPGLPLQEGQESSTYSMPAQRLDNCHASDDAVSRRVQDQAARPDYRAILHGDGVMGSGILNVKFQVHGDTLLLNEHLKPDGVGSTQFLR